MALGTDAYDFLDTSPDRMRGCIISDELGSVIICLLRHFAGSSATVRGSAAHYWETSECSQHWPHVVWRRPQDQQNWRGTVETVMLWHRTCCCCCYCWWWWWRYMALKKVSTYTWYNTYSWIITSEALRYGTCSQGISQFYLHTHTFIRNRNEPYLPLHSQL